MELLVGVVLMGLAMAATSALFLASRFHIREQGKQLETTQAARSVIDVIVRDLRLSGACLPVTGQFVSLEGIDDPNRKDEIITRTGITRSDLSCIRTSTENNTPASERTVQVDSVEGFQTGMRAYLRHPDGSGEYFTVTNPDARNVPGRALR